MSDDQRLHSLDILRGFALFGMILVHFHQKMRVEVGGAEDLIGWAVYLLVEEKAWGTFAFLFGVGFALLLRRLDARRERVVPIYLRRLATLAVFGVIAEVGFGFSILFTYACWGLALLVMRKWSTRSLLLAAALAAIARPLAAELMAIWSWNSGTPLTPSSTFAPRAAVEAAATEGSYLDLLAARWVLFTTSGGWRALLPDSNLALFLLGLLAVRHHVIDAPLQHARSIRRWMLFGAVSWFLAWVVLPRLPESPIPGASWPYRQAGFGIANDQWLCFTYIGAVLLLLAWRPRLMARLAAVGQAGRMALTNYMIQVAVLDLLASGYGFGLKLRPLVYLPAAIVFFAFEAAWSTAWLARAQHGPLEGLWRAITYWRRAPPIASTRSS